MDRIQEKDAKKRRVMIKKTILLHLMATVLFSWVAMAAPRSGDKTTENAPASAGAAQSGTRLMVSGKSLHMSCNRSLRNLATNTLECFGNVYIRRPSELLTSDYALMDMSTEQLHAEGNVVYFTPDTVIYGAKMDFNFVSETGTITNGRVESDKFELLGETIERLDSDHFKVVDGEYTTCRDCPASWKLVGKKIDMKIDGYASMQSVFLKVNEAPTFYMPYALIPVKTKRQTGLLFPKFQFTGQNGTTYLQKFFWAISRSQDATLGLGWYSARGLKSDLEYRYVFSEGSYGNFNGYYLRDHSFIGDPFYDRWAVNYDHNWKLPFGIESKTMIRESSDRDYARKIGDIKGTGEPALVSETGLSKTSRDANIWITANRIHTKMTPGLVDFDPGTVQLQPSVSFASLDHQIHEKFPLSWGVTANYSRFWRDAASFDGSSESAESIFAPFGDTPLRKANRWSLTPQLYYSSKIAERIELTPSLQYRSFYYSFDPKYASTTVRGYLVAQAEVGTTIEKVYAGTVKHKFRPSLTYSNIPFIQEDGHHPFVKQILKSGNQFDQVDIVPISNDTQLYFVPLGNSLTYRFGNKLILRSDHDKIEDRTYKTIVDLTAGQSLNFIEYRKPSAERRQPFSRFFAEAKVDLTHIQATGIYYYYPYLKNPAYTVDMTYIFARYTRRLLSFERSLTLGYSFDQVTAQSNSIRGGFYWSFNDYFAATAGISYNFPMTLGIRENQRVIPGKVMSTRAGIVYQSPSQCYQVMLGASRTVEQPKVEVSFSVPINLTGDGFSNLQDGGGLPVQSR